MTNDILTAYEAAELLRVDYGTLRKMCSQGKVPYRRLGSTYRFSREALLAWLSTAPEKGGKRASISPRQEVAFPKAG